MGALWNGISVPKSEVDRDHFGDLTESIFMEQFRDHGLGTIPLGTW
jgi:hypothetical protein